MLDSDDLWLNNHIECCLDTLTQKEGDGLYGSLILVNTTSDEKKTVLARNLHKDESMIDYLLNTGYGAQTSTLFMTSESCKDILWDPELINEQDYDFVIRYSKKYKLVVKETPTTLYTLRNSSLSSFLHFDSRIRFLDKNEEDISPNIYYNYCLNLLYRAKQIGTSDEIIEYFREGASYYKELIPFRQYLRIKEPKNLADFEKYRSEYIQYLQELKVE
jgi:hypothetical protein